MVPVDEVQRDTLDALDCFTKVVVGRAKGKGAGVYVQPCTNQEPAWTSTLVERQHSADVTTSLLTVWGVQEVTSFFCGAGASDNVLSLDIERGDECERKRGFVADSPQPTYPPDPLDVNESYVEVVNRMKGRGDRLKPSTNGDH
jgi:hypothetical protein